MDRKMMTKLFANEQSSSAPKQTEDRLAPENVNRAREVGGDLPVQEVHIEPIPLIQEVAIDGLAALRIIKHCHENYPTLVAGSLLGLDIEKTLEVTYSFAFPQPKSSSSGNDGEARDKHDDAIEDLEGGEYQIEMMKMLRDVNIDNNCVGWYQSMYMGTISTNDVVNYQYSYQSSEELSENSVVIMYDPVLSRKGDLHLKAFRLSEKFMELKKNHQNKFIKPSEILEEIPLKVKNSGYITAFLRSLEDSHEDELATNEFEVLNMTGTENIAEKHMEMINIWVDDLINEQQKFQGYVRNAAKLRAQDPHHAKLATMEVPNRNDHLLMLAQLERYSHQLNEHVGTSLEKLTLTHQVNKTSN